MSRTSYSRFPLICAGLFGATGVAIGALGAHRLQAQLDERGMTHAWETGSRYHLFHAIALLAIAAYLRDSSEPPRGLRLAVWFWSIGIIFFSGSLYWFALGGPHGLVYATPIGGIALVAGWACVIAAAFRKPTGTG